MCNQCNDHASSHSNSDSIEATDAPKIDVSLITVPYKDGDEIKVFIEEVIVELEKLDLTWEFLAMESNVKGGSQKVLKELADKHENFHMVLMSHPGVTVTDKTKKYIAGFQLAQGKYIITMDSDGQDDPKELGNFVKKLDEGYDMVGGWKQNRGDGAFYMISSKFVNFFTKALTGVKIHDMNNGFKGWKAEVAKEIKLRGGMFRFIPAMLTAQNKKITEVPVTHRKRMFGAGRFNFVSRLQGGMFDMLTVVALNKMQQTPMYLFGWFGVFGFIASFAALATSFYVQSLYTSLMLGMLGFTLMGVAFVACFIGIALAYQLWQTPMDSEDFGILDIYSGKESGQHS